MRLFPSASNLSSVRQLHLKTCQAVFLVHRERGFSLRNCDYRHLYRQMLSRIWNLSHALALGLLYRTLRHA